MRCFVIRIFIGTSESTNDKKAETVLEHTLRKNCSEEIEIVFMRNTLGSFFGDFDSSSWWTPFSLLRWAIPAYCNFKGRALYMDVDQVNFKDIAELFHMDMQEKAIAIREKDVRTCVMLLDCEKLKSLLPSIENLKTNNYNDNIFNRIVRENSIGFDERWNCLDGGNRRVSDIWHLHFTEMSTQPWHPQWAHDTWKKKGHEFNEQKHPRGDLVYIWNYLLKEATNA